MVDSDAHESFRMNFHVNNCLDIFDKASFFKFLFYIEV